MDTKPEGITGQPAEIRFTVHVTRKETGKTDTYEMVGHVQPQQKEPDDGSHPQHRGA